MRCPKCGNQVSAGAKFCRNCGARLTPEASAVPNPAGRNSWPEAGAEKTVRRRPGKWVLAAALVLILALAAAATYLLLGRQRNSGADCFFLQDGNYMLADLKEGQAFPVIASMTEVGDVLFGPDETYAFLFVGNDTLCRVNCTGLDPEGDNADQVIKVDSGVQRNEMTLLTGGRAVYRKPGNDLYYFNGETVNRLAGDVILYSLLDSETIVYLVETEEGYIVYWVPLDGSKAAVPLTGDEMACLWSSIEPGEQAAYSVQTEDGWEALYLVGADGVPQLVNDAARIYDYGELRDTLYYTADTAMLDDADSFSFNGTLCSLKDGAVTQLAERVNNYWLSGDQLIYLVENDLNQERAAANFSISDVRMDPICYHRFFVMAEGMPAVEVDMDNLMSVWSQEGSEVFWIETILFTGTDVFVEDNLHRIYSAPVADGAASGFALFATDAEMLSVNNGVLYYTEGQQPSMSAPTGSLYCFQAGEKICLSQDVNPWQIWIYEDGTVLAIRNLDTSGTAQGELVMLDAAEGETVIAEDVTEWMRLDEKTVMYCSGGSLYRFEKGESELLAGDVNGLWCRQSLEPVYERELYIMELD